FVHLQRFVAIATANPAVTNPWSLQQPKRAQAAALPVVEQSTATVDAAREQRVGSTGRVGLGRKPGRRQYLRAVRLPRVRLIAIGGLAQTALAVGCARKARVAGAKGRGRRGRDR